LLYTLNKTVYFEGTGVHSGEPSRIDVIPTVDDVPGIFFLNKTKCVRAFFHFVQDTSLCTNLSGFSTIEHLCAALYGIGITNAIISVSGNEIPILDGSALNFVEAFGRVGLRTSEKKSRKLKILKKVEVRNGDRRTSLSPSDSFVINVECDFRAKGLQTEPFHFDFSRDNFVKEIAPARTFGFLADAEFYRKHNLALGASTQNTVIFDEKGTPINEGGLRFPDEPIRHKVLDIIGDLSLAQAEIEGQFDSFCPSHKMNNMILHKLFEEEDNYRFIDG
jgi:UDP-3-O-[3-hydroxymyristoyl] N-acetylglucosamine deacetylase